MANKHVCIDEIRGCEGNCITINDYRVAGPKPWGSGIVVKNWVADVDDVIRALRDNDVVKVVRCKDCKYYDRKKEDCDHPVLWFEYCSDCGFSMKPDDFCTYGERKNDA